MRPTINPKTVKLALKITGILLVVAGAVVAQWEAGAITNAASFVMAIADALTGALNEQP